jgi:hypothetical protein
MTSRVKSYWNMMPHHWLCSLWQKEMQSLNFWGQAMQKKLDCLTLQMMPLWSLYWYLSASWHSITFYNNKIFSKPPWESQNLQNMTWTWHFKNDSLCIINKHITPATRLHGSTNPVQWMKMTVSTKNIIIDDFHQFCPKKSSERNSNDILRTFCK